MHRQVVHSKHSSTATVLKMATEDSEELYVCQKCGAVHKKVVELIEDEMEHVTPEFES